MFEVITSGDEANIFLNGKLIIKHTPDDPFIWAGKGKWQNKFENVSDRCTEHSPLHKARYDAAGQIIRFSGSSFSVSFHIEEKDGALVLSPQRATTGLNRLKLRFHAEQVEAVYGGGAQYERLDLRGMRIPLWVRERRLYERGVSGPSTVVKALRSHPSAFPIPVYITESCTFASFDCTSFAVFDFTSAKERVVSLFELPASFTIGVCKTMPELMSVMTKHLGRQPMLPHWATDGVMLKVTGGSHNVALQMEKLAGVKVSSLLFMDWTGTRESRAGHMPFFDWIWNKELYPKLDNFINGLSKSNIRSLAYAAPHFSIEGRQYAEASMNGFLLKKPQGGHYINDIDGFMAGHLDLTNSRACSWFKQILKDNVLSMGFSGCFAGMGGFIPPDAIFSNGENPQRIRNSWPVLWSKLHRETIREAGRGGDSAFISSSGWMYSGSNAMIAYGGDFYMNYSKRCGLPSALTSALSLSSSGMGLSVSENGGNIPFIGYGSKELLMRWYEFGAFMPIFMVALGREKGPGMDSDILKHFLRMSKVHNLLAPYIRACLKENTSSGMPPVRPLFMQFPGEGYAAAHDAFMLGSELLVAPVLIRNQKARKLRLPNGHWTDIWTGRTHKGGDIICHSPIGKPPVFYKSDGKFSDEFTDFERKIKD